MPILSVTDILQRSFEYIIVGGGTTGLALATRLSENPDVKVLVIEAGPENLHDPLIDIPGQFGAVFGNPKYDWLFSTVKQKHVNDKELPWYRGKGLGGTSNINLYIWSKPPAADVDAFEKLGNPGWNWTEYEKYTRKSETFHPPAKEQTDLYPHTFNANMRGSSGPIQVTIPPHAYHVDAMVRDTMIMKGLKVIEDPSGGDITGTWICPTNMDPKTWLRSNSASGYLIPNLGRDNLSIVTNCLVSRVLFDDASTGQDFTATGVEFIHAEETYTVKVIKEVILSAGTVNSPQILELSGIGNPKILSKIDVDIKVNLPGVGENLQDHSFVRVCYELSAETSHETFDLLNDAVYATKSMELHALGQGIRRLGVTSFSYIPLSVINPVDAPGIIKRAEEDVKRRQEKGDLLPGLSEQLDIQLTMLRDDKLPDHQIVAYPGLFPGTDKPEPGKSYVSMLACLNHPFSRGYIHAQSKDPRIYPTIDPNYLENAFDREVHMQDIKFIKSLANTEPFKSGITREISPGANCCSDAEIEEYIKDNISPVWHAVGTCSMLPRSKNGVVDPNLKVYGTSNLRIADISIIPLHFASHPQTMAYVIAERAADIIKKTLQL